MRTPVRLQPKLKVNPPGDRFEQEADRVAEQVMRMPEPQIQRACPCGGGCPKCQAEALGREREHSQTNRTHDNRGEQISPPIVREVLGSPGQPIDPVTRTFMEMRFGHDFSRVRVHSDSVAEQSAREVNANAYTVGHNIAFATGQFDPSSPTGLRLLSHELTHVVQQRNVESGESGIGMRKIVMRQPRDKSTKTPAPSQKGTAQQTIRMHFDGRDLIVYEGETEKFRFSTHSGRPTLLSEEDAKNCGADVRTDTYLDDKRFVGIEDHGPIPEGTYTFSPPGIERFTTGEQFELLWGGVLGKKEIEISGHNIHPGDWGRGRVELNKQGMVKEGPCGKANERKGFFLHGGILAGSSGCVDIDGDFANLADFLKGYQRNIVLTVSYEHGPSSVYFFRGLLGAIAKKSFQLSHGPQLRLGTEFAPGTTRFLASVSYEGIVKWAGGAASLGVKIDVPLNDREAFVRAGLTSAVNFRILGSLYGRLTGGLDVNLAAGRGAGEVGGGLGYDFGRVQLEALYNVLLPFSQSDPEAHQLLVGVGFRFH
jgi:hypothetical protein